MNDGDKAIRAAKLTLGGMLEKGRAKQAQERAPGQIAPSKYMPGVPRAVHAAGGYVPAPMMQGTPRLAVAKAPIQAQQSDADVLASLSSLTDTFKSFKGGEDAPPAATPEPHAGRAEAHGYGEGISSDAAKAMAALQGAWTGQDFGIVSGYRDPKKNEEVGGAKGSQHIHGNAFDVDTTGWPEEDKLALATLAREQGFKGFGFYDNNMHFDVGGQRVWGPSFSSDSIPEWAQPWYQDYMGYADGGEVADLGQAREQKQIKQYHTGLMGDVKTGMNSMMEAHQKALDAGVFDGYEVGDVLQGSAHPMRITGRFMRKWKPSPMTLQSFDRMGTKPTIIEHEDTQYIPMLRYETGQEGTEGWQSGDAYLDGVKAAGYQKMGGLRSVKADGGAAMFEGIHPDLQNEQGKPMDLWHGTPVEGGFDAFSNDKLGSGRDPGFYGRGHYLTPDYDTAESYADPSEMGGGKVMGPLHAALKNPFVWDMSDENKAYSTKKSLEEMGIKREGKMDPWDNLQSHEISKFMEHMGKRGHDGVIVKQPNWQDGSGSHVSEIVVFKPNAIKHKNAEVFDPNDPRIMRAGGGRTITDHGLYSRAAEIIRGLPQEKGTVDQYIAAAKKLGAKPSELEHAGRPEGDKISREDMAKHFDRNLPKMEVHQYGENPSYLSREQEKRLYALGDKKWQSGRGGEPLSEAEEAEHALLTRRTKGPEVKYESNEYNEDNEPRPTEYEGYNLPGGINYRERLLTLPETNSGNDYRSSHWSDNDNVLAHIRMQDRTIGGDRESMRPIVQKIAEDMGAGVRDLSSGSAEYAVKNKLITPEEAASLSRFMGWTSSPYHSKPGLDKRVLHVEEMQSDWGQEGKKAGFYDPKNPYEIFNTKTGETLSKHPSQDAMWDAYRSIPEDQAAGLDYGHARHTSEKKPAAPYVHNTQHWTDLALKNVLHEAAMGNYDHVVFTPGQAQADRYGLDKHLDKLVYDPEKQTLHGHKGSRANVFYKDNVSPEDLPSYIGSDVSQRLLHPDNKAFGVHTLEGDDLKAGGQGMKGYYDNILPKSVMRLAQQHDPDIKPGSMPLSDEYTGFSIPMTDKLKQGILGGQTAFRRGGMVEKADGGPINGQQDIAGTPQARPQAGELPVSGGVRGSGGVLPAQGETPLEGLPQNIRIPLTGGSLQAGPDPRIREIARQYMASSGLPYNPPAKYAKVDPGRAKRIAAAYEAMPDNPDDPLTKASYAALAKETMAQYQAAKAAGFKAEFWHPSKQEDPYLASPRLAVEDVRNNHHMWVYPTYAGYGSGEITDEDVQKNPMLQGTGEHWNGIPVTVNDVFRAIHDYYGHAKEGVGFRADGEENAWRAHASMFSPLARMAMTSETRGQNSWLNYGPHGDANRGARTEDTVFAPQKVGIMPDWVHHEGAEDFIRPEDVAEMKRARTKHSADIEKALAVTRSFTKDGKTATMKLKLKE
jgi:hypothetical protein